MRVGLFFSARGGVTGSSREPRVENTECAFVVAEVGVGCTESRDNSVAGGMSFSVGAACVVRVPRCEYGADATATAWLCGGDPVHLVVESVTT